MDEAAQKLWDAERDVARKFIVANGNIGTVTHLDDGKDEVFLRLSYKDLVQLLASYGVERINSFATNMFDGLGIKTSPSPR